VWPSCARTFGGGLGLVMHIDGLEVSLDAEGMGARLRGLRVSRRLLSEARDIGAEVPGFVAAKLHVGHLGVWIH
jgi:hypothetical protein